MYSVVYISMYSCLCILRTVFRFYITRLQDVSRVGDRLEQVEQAIESTQRQLTQTPRDDRERKQRLEKERDELRATREKLGAQRTELQEKLSSGDVLSANEDRT